MIRIDEQNQMVVEFDYVDMRAKPGRISLGLDAYLLLVKESKDLESLKVLILEHGTRRPCGAVAAAAVRV